MIKIKAIIREPVIVDGVAYGYNSYDISDYVTRAVYSAALEGQCGKLTLTLAACEHSFVMGSTIIFNIVDDRGLFKGSLFTQTIDEFKNKTLVFYDQLRYWKNTDTLVVSNQTILDIFNLICAKLKAKNSNFTYYTDLVISSTADYILTSKVYDEKTLYQIIDDLITETFINTGVWLMLKDNYGTLSLLNVANMTTKYILNKDITPENLNFEESIDKDSFNSIKLIRPFKNSDGENLKQVIQLEDTANIAQWGTLQYTQAFSDSATQAQLEAKAQQILDAKNYSTQELNFTCVGNFDIMPGNSFFVDFENITGDKEKKLVLVSSAEHIIENGSHMMNLSVII